MKRTSSSSNEMHQAAGVLFGFMYKLINKTSKTHPFGALNDYDKFKRYAHRMYQKLWKYSEQD